LIAAAREKKRQDLWKGVAKLYSRQCPAWLKWSEEACKFVVLEERAAIVRAIYEKADQGWSHDRIARWLNTQRTPTWGGGKRQATHWRGSYILKITKNAAAIGTFIPRRTEHDELTGARRDVPLDPAHNYYPSVVDRDLFERVRARTSATAPRGRNAGRVTTSIFAGLIVCSKAHAKGDCEYMAVPYKAVEQAFTSNVDLLIEEAPRGNDSEAENRLLGGLEVHADNLGEEAQALLDEWLETRSPSVRRKQRDKELEWEEATMRLREARARTAYRE
jgi:recombinase